MCLHVFSHTSRPSNLDSLNVNEKPPPIVKLAYAQHHAQLLAFFFFFYGQPIRGYSHIHYEIVSHIGEAQ